MADEHKDWQQVQSDWQARMMETTAFGQPEYREKWSMFCEKVDRASPVDPDSTVALDLVREAVALFEPHFRTTSASLWPELFRGIGGWTLKGVISHPTEEMFHMLSEAADCAIARGEWLVPSK